MTTQIAFDIISLGASALVTWQLARVALNSWRAEDVAPTPLQTLFLHTPKRYVDRHGAAVFRADQDHPRENNATFAGALRHEPWPRTLFALAIFLSLLCAGMTISVRDYRTVGADLLLHAGLPGLKASAGELGQHDSFTLSAIFAVHSDGGDLTGK